jgi:hypothetical protein
MTPTNQDVMSEAVNHVEHQVHSGLGSAAMQKSEFSHQMHDPVVTQFRIVGAHGRRDAVLANQIIGKNFVEGLPDGREGLSAAILFRCQNLEPLFIDHGSATQDFEKVVEVWLIQEDGTTRGYVIDPRFLEQHDVEADTPQREGVAGPDNYVQDSNFKVDEVGRLGVEQGFEVTKVKAREAPCRAFAGMAPALDKLVMGDVHGEIFDMVPFAEKGEKEAGMGVGARGQCVGAAHNPGRDAGVTKETKFVKKWLAEEGGAEGLGEMGIIFSKAGGLNVSLDHAFLGGAVWLADHDIVEATPAVRVVKCLNSEKTVLLFLLGVELAELGDSVSVPCSGMSKRQVLRGRRCAWPLSTAI